MIIFCTISELISIKIFKRITILIFVLCLSLSLKKEDEPKKRKAPLNGKALLNT